MKKPFSTPRILQLVVPIFATASLSLPALACDPVSTSVGPVPDSTGSAVETVTTTYSLAGNCSVPCCPLDPAQADVPCPDSAKMTYSYSIVTTRNKGFNFTLARLFHYVTGVAFQGSGTTQTTASTVQELAAFKYTKPSKGHQVQLFLRKDSTSYSESRHDGNASASAQQNPSVELISWRPSQSMGINQTFDPCTNKYTPPTPDPCP